MAAMTTREELLCLAEEFDKWLEYMVEKYNWDKNEVQSLIKQFLM